MAKRRVYEEIRGLVEMEGGEMLFVKQGHQWGAWIVTLRGKRKTFRSNGSGFPELDRLYVPKPDVSNPNHWRDYSLKLIDGAWDKFLGYFSEA